VRICHITPHLPPDQAANALLPFHLGAWAVQAGDAVTYIAHHPRTPGGTTWPGPVTWIPSHRRRGAWMRHTRLGAVVSATDVVRRGAPRIREADVVHVHGNGLLTEVGAAVASWQRKPTVLTLYGTDVWHYRAPTLKPDLFARAFRQASHVTFYSDGLRSRARELGLAQDATSVIYPPVADSFTWQSQAGQVDARRQLGLTRRHVLVNVKHLHPYAAQHTLIEAMPALLQTHPDTHLIVCGSGPLLAHLQQMADAAGVGRHVTFAGLVDNQTVAQYCAAADLFVLPSVLEACPTVALEALACGTPVVTADSPGGVELGGRFGRDVVVVPREDPDALAAAIRVQLDERRRTTTSTAQQIEQELRLSVVGARFRSIYEACLA
jgi:glycosyltransferase involved in cell wall biosynthesis